MAKEIKENGNEKTAKKRIPSMSQIEEYYKDVMKNPSNYSEKEKKLAKTYFNAKEEKARLDKESAERKEARKNMSFKEKFKQDFVPSKTEIYGMLTGVILVAIGFGLYHLIAYIIK